MPDWPYLAISVGWLLAALVLFLAGAFYGQTNRFEGCELSRIGPQPVYICAVGEPVLEGEQA